MENPAAELPAQAEQGMPEVTAEMEKVKKHKKQKREEEQNSVKVQREDVQCKQEPSGQDEDWCLGETWKINSDGSSERPKQQPHLSTQPKLSQTQEQIQPMLCETPLNHHDSAIKKKKKKKKHKEKLDDENKKKHETDERLVVFSTEILLFFLTNMMHFLKPCLMQHPLAPFPFIERLR